MGSILAVLERLIERQSRRKLMPEPATIPPYPDASKAVEDFQLKLARRVQANQEEQPALKQG